MRCANFLTDFDFGILRFRSEKTYGFSEKVCKRFFSISMHRYFAGERGGYRQNRTVEQLWRKVIDICGYFSASNWKSKLRTQRISWQKVDPMRTTLYATDFHTFYPRHPQLLLSFFKNLNILIFYLNLKTGTGLPHPPSRTETDLVCIRKMIIFAVPNPLARSGKLKGG